MSTINAITIGFTSGILSTLISEFLKEISYQQVSSRIVNDTDDGI
jgi:hypothetical protein